MKINYLVKKQKVEKGLELGVVMLHLDARRIGVQVPKQLSQNMQLRLNISLKYKPYDLSVNDWGIKETLSFGGNLFPVAIPWSAIFGITTMEKEENTILFPTDIPQELFQQKDYIEKIEQQKEQTEFQEMKKVSGMKQQVLSSGKCQLKLVVSNDLGPISDEPIFTCRHLHIVK